MDAFKEDFWSEVVFLRECFRKNKIKSANDGIEFFELLPTHASITKELIAIFLCMPSSNPTAERSFSGLRRIKTWLRATMKEDRLASIARLHLK